MPVFYYDDPVLRQRFLDYTRLVESMLAAGVRIKWLRLWEKDYETMRSLAGIAGGSGQLRFMDIPVYIRKGIHQ